MARREGTTTPALTVLGLLASVGINVYQAHEWSELAQQNADYEGISAQLLHENSLLCLQIQTLMRQDAQWRNTLIQMEAIRDSYRISSQNEREQRERIEAHLAARDSDYARLQEIRNQVLQHANQLAADLESERQRADSLQARVTELESEIARLTSPPPGSSGVVQRASEAT